MPRRRTTTRSAKRRFKWGSLKKLLPAARTRKRWWKNFKRAPPQAQFVVTALVLMATWLAVNWVYQVARKPTELFFPVSGTL
ncbi:MAG TPA: hypothetical protein VK629_13785, partial [Steroidobacteraceae bacterium]|nr:hypothetical protein [Steroidobacteraceae bacterium]